MPARQSGTGRPRQYIRCQHCGKLFRTRNPQKQYCSVQCRAAAQQSRRRARRDTEQSGKL